MSEQPGLAGVVPFRFGCHRCGHCCTVGSGFVWLEESELPRLAAARDLDVPSFVRQFVRKVPDPQTGRERLALRERAEGGGGRCVLLEGHNECSVYTERPEHCRTFPFWQSVLEDEAAFERAREVCPGIAVEVRGDVRAAAFEQLEALYAEVDAFVAKVSPVCIRRGVCCRFEDAGHELWSTALEADFAADRHPEAPAPEAPGRCPYHVAGACTAREGRPLACRTYFCDSRWQSVLEEAHEHFLTRLRQIERFTGFPPAYAKFPALLAGRGIGQGQGASS